MTGAIVRFTVYGRPAPQGSKVAVSRHYLKESSPYLRDWRDAVKKAGALERVRLGWARGLDEPLALAVVLAVAGDPAEPPDLDKLVRAIGDGLTDSGLIKDDALIVRFDLAEKCRPGHHPLAPPIPGAWIQLRTIRSPFD